MAMYVAGGRVFEITVCNRALALILTDDERLRAVHRVLCLLGYSEQ